MNELGEAAGDRNLAKTIAATIVWIVSAIDEPGFSKAPPAVVLEWLSMV